MFYPFSSLNNKSCIQLHYHCAMHFNDKLVTTLELQLQFRCFLMYPKYFIRASFNYVCQRGREKEE